MRTVIISMIDGIVDDFRLSVRQVGEPINYVEEEKGEREHNCPGMSRRGIYTRLKSRRTFTETPKFSCENSFFFSEMSAKEKKNKCYETKECRLDLFIAPGPR